MQVKIKKELNAFQLMVDLKLFPDKYRKDIYPST